MCSNPGTLIVFGIQHRRTLNQSFKKGRSCQCNRRAKPGSWVRLTRGGWTIYPLHEPIRPPNELREFAYVKSIDSALQKELGKIRLCRKAFPYFMQVKNIVRWCWRSMCMQRKLVLSHITSKLGMTFETLGAKWLLQIQGLLIEKGAPKQVADERAHAVYQGLGTRTLRQVLASRDPWGAL